MGDNQTHFNSHKALINMKNNNNIKITQDNLKNSQVITLLEEHHGDMLKHSPETSVHALDVSTLQHSDITFWTAWFDNNLAGCIALKKLTHDHAELKSMRTAEKYLNKGVASTLLAHIIDIAAEQHYTTISLETGTATAFSSAQKLYKKFGFVECPPFSNYEKDPYSMFFTKQLPN